MRLADNQVLVLLFVVINNRDIVSHDLDFLDKGRLLSSLSNLGIRISHDGDKHVEEGDLGDKSGKEEEDPNKHCVFSHIILLKGLKVTQSHQVLVKEDVYNRIAEVRNNNIISCCIINGSIVVEDEHSVSKCEQNHENQYEENHHISNGINHHSNVE